jgi:hypothetical protein
MFEHILVWLVDILDRDDGQVSVIAEVAESNARPRLHASLFYRLLRKVKRDGHRKEVSICKTVLADNAAYSLVTRFISSRDSMNVPIVVFLAHKT